MPKKCINKGTTSTDAGQIGNATDMHGNANVDANVAMGNKADSSNVPSSANEKMGSKEKTSDANSSSESCTDTDCVATDGDSKEGVPVIRLKNVGTKDNIILEFESTDPHEPVGFKPLDEGANASENVAKSDHQAENAQVTSTENSATESATNLCADDTCSGGNVCFIAGTLVETIHGLRPIETLDLGDWVWSRQEFGQDYDYRPVVSTKATPDQPIYEVVVTNAQGEQETFYTTEEHPFYVEGLGWRKTMSLEAGMVLLDRQGNPTLSVIRQQATDRKETVYNIEVEDFSTYHIGQLGVWVHNADCCDMRLPVPTPVKTKFGLYQSNQKHTLGMPGKKNGAGIEPRNSLQLFENSVDVKSVSDGIRFAQDESGNIHRFFYDRGSKIWHWSGSTGDIRHKLILPNEFKNPLTKAGFKGKVLK